MEFQNKENLSGHFPQHVKSTKNLILKKSLKKSAQCSISICLENLWFSGIFRRYRNGTLEWNVGLKWVKNNLDKSLKKTLQKALKTLD